MKSEKGCASQTPSNPQIGGNSRIAGIRNKTCRLRLRNIAFHATPILRKNWLIVIWEPTTKKTSIVRRNPLSVIDTNSASVENTLTISLGNNKLTIHPTPVIKVVTIIDYRKVANTLS